MENDWDILKWETSIHHTMRKPGQSEVSSQALNGLKQKLRNGTLNIIDLPYLPMYWANRGATLYHLGYPNLAASDAYKGILLFNAGLDRKGDVGEKVWLTFGLNCWMRSPQEAHWKHHNNNGGTHKRMIHLMQLYRLQLYGLLLNCLDRVMAYQDGITISTEALLLYPSDRTLRDFQEKTKAEYAFRARYLITEFKVGKEQLWSSSKLGQIASVAYPWAPTHLMVRSQQVIDEANKHVKQCSDSKMQIGKAALGVQSGQASLGIFATRDIKAGEIMFDSTGPVGISPQQTIDCCYNCFAPLQKSTFTIPCCPTIKYCSNSCVSTAKTAYHLTLHGKDFSDLYSSFQNSPVKYAHCPAFLKIGWLRYLAIAVQSGGHPLQCQFFAQLTAQYGAAKPGLSWSLESNISGPVDILGRLGVNVFVDLSWDAWVLETIRERTRTNAFSADDSAGTSCPFVDPVYSFHNHSCEKNMMEQVVTDSSRCLFRAARAIRKGEEIFVSYIGNAEGMVKEERDGALVGWLAGVCACRRCLRES